MTSRHYAFSIFAAVAVLATSAFGAVETVSAEGTGFWMESFAMATNYSWQTKTPLVLLWSNKGCGECAKLEEAVSGKDFVAYQSSSSYAYCYVMGVSKKDAGVNKDSGANEFARSAAGTIADKKKWLTSFPYVCLYWPQTDGTFKATAFTGRDGTMLVKELVAKGHPLEAQLEDSVEKFFAGYVSVRFAATGSAWDRYEADPGFTTNVPVKVVSSARPAGFRLVASYPYGAQDFTAPLEFDASGVAEVVVPVSGGIGDGMLGREIALSVQTDAGVERASGAITLCRPENGASNPLWTTERDIDSLKFGEWTADIDVATQMVARAGVAWTIVELAGSLWCPDCYRTDVNFLEDGGKFSEWAVANNVALVSVDTPHNSKADPDPVNPVGTIWSRDTDMTKLVIAPFPDADADKVARSGKGYLSRKMVSDADALAVARRNLWLSKDYYHRPEDYATHRTLIPIFVLLDSDGRVKGRFETFDARSQSPTDRSNTDNYIKRFAEMIEMAETMGDTVSDNHWSTTTRSLANGVETCDKISHCDYHDVYALDGVAPGTLVKVTVSGTSNRKLHLDLLSVSKGAATTVGTAEGALSAGFSAEFLAKSSGGAYARVYCWPGDDTHPVADAGFAATEGASTITDYTVRFDSVIVPQETAASAVAQGGHCTIRIEPGCEYVLSGEADWEKDGALVPVVGKSGHYSATVAASTDIVYEVGGSGEFDYQKWAPGAITLSVSAVSALEREGGVTIKATRSGGSSGRTVVTVSAVNEVNAAGRYELKTTELTWESGETGEREIVVSLKDDGIYQGVGTVDLVLAAGEECAASVAKGLSVRLSIYDTDKPVFAKSSYSMTMFAGFACEERLDLFNIDVAKSLKLKKASGSASLPSGMSLKYDKSTGTAVLSGSTKRTGTYVTSYSVAQGKDTGDSSEIKIIVLDPRKYNARLGVARTSQILPLVADYGASSVVAGNLTVTISSANKISAKYIGTESKSLLFSGPWQSLDEDTGTASATLTAKGGATLDISMDVEGRILAALALPSGYNHFGEDFVACGDWPGSTNFSAWRGYYTIALPVVDASPATAPSGTAYITLAMTASRAVASGTASFSGVMPDGKSISGSVQLIPDGDYARADIFARSGNNVFGASLLISPDGEAFWDDPVSVSNREVVNPVEGMVTYVLHRQAGLTYVTLHDVCGSWYPTSLKVGSVVAAFYQNPATEFAVGIGGIGRIAMAAYDGKKFALTEAMAGTSLKVADKKGTFSGKAAVEIDGKKVSGTLKGVLVPGWYENCDCGDVPKEIPFGNGLFIYKAKVGSTTATLSLPVVIDEPAD